MHIHKVTPVLALIIAAQMFSPAAIAQTAAGGPQMPTIEMESTSASVGIGGQSGRGVVYLPNLGANCSYPFTVSGFGAGIQVGISRASATGVVANMTKVADLSGSYSATQGEATLLAGAGSTNMKNQNNNVTIGLKSRTEGLALGVGGSGMTLQVAEPPVSSQRTYVMTFGYNKSHLNRDTRATLDQIVRNWKCHYGALLVFGNADTTGRQTENLNLSELRAVAVHDYLLQRGVAESRVVSQPRGETMPIVPTGNDVRLRTNRNVIVVVKD